MKHFSLKEEDVTYDIYYNDSDTYPFIELYVCDIYCKRTKTQALYRTLMIGTKKLKLERYKFDYSYLDEKWVLIRQR